ncbi:hypothetical protein GCK32_014457 [Trichostrongylus colubriformis]|uniref:Uncharacterized protein n=1 Tax=Trichostrongylus colubriformis TaxID=6319 RepID=A0AAN8EVU7_TRICO
MVNNGQMGANGYLDSLSTDRSRELNTNGRGYPQNGGQQTYNGQYSNQGHSTDQRDLHNVPYTNGNGFAAPQSYPRPPLPDVNGINHPSGYVPQAEMSAQASVPHFILHCNLCAA